MRDTNFAEEQVYRIDKEVDKVFPEFRKFFNASKVEERKQFLTRLDNLLFEGDLTKKLDPSISKEIEKTIKSKLGKEGQTVFNNITSANKVRNEFNNLLNITAQGPGAKAIYL